MGFLRELLLKNKDLRNKFHRFIIREYEEKLGKRTYFNNAKYDLTEANALIAQGIATGEPLLIGRLGGTEARVITEYYYKRQNSQQQQPYDQHVLDEGAVLSGIYPPVEEIGDYFSKEYIESIRACDMLAVWGTDNEDLFIREYCPDIPTLSYYSVLPLLLFKPWTYQLKGKKILVATSFTDTITKQYQKREALFESPYVLPEFDLITYKTIQAYGGENADYASYIEVLQKMTSDISNLEFDIALIGAGAYALPLGRHIKSMGKIAITTCGATQLFFGIKGARWIESGEFDEIMTPAWTDLPEEEKPVFSSKAREILSKFEVNYPYGKSVNK